MQRKHASEDSEEDGAATKQATSVNVKKKQKGGSMQATMQDKLHGAQFRWLNEKLYTTRGTDAWEMMQVSIDRDLPAKAMVKEKK
jgi:hypothetical protein